MTRETLQHAFDAAQQLYQQAQSALEAAGREMIYLKGKLDLLEDLGKLGLLAELEQQQKDNDHGMDSA